MSEVRVVGVALDSAGQQVILLKPTDERAGGGKLLPIWIGALEVTSIMAAVQQAEVPRPLAHDLMRSIVEALGATVDRVEITSLEEGTFYAVVHLITPAGEHTIDARPSDAIALATRAQAPIDVSDDVLEEAGIDDTITGPSEDEAPVIDEQRLDEFRDFLDTVDPEDFKE